MSKLKSDLGKVKEVANQKIKEGDYANQAKSLASDVVSDVSSMKNKSPKSIIQIIKKNKVLKVAAIVILILLALNVLGGGGKAKKAEKIAKAETIQDYKGRDYKNPKVSVKCIAKNSKAGFYAIDMTITGKDWGGKRFKDTEISVVQIGRTQYDEIIDSRTYNNRNDKASSLDSLKGTYNMK